MKKLLLLTVCISSVLCAFSQSVVSLGDNTSYWGGPVYILKEYSHTQTIYLASDIQGAGDIDSVCYFAADTNLDISNSDDWLVSVAHTPLTTFTSPASYGWQTNTDTVFSGTVYLVNDTVCIPFDEPFTYNGVDNLLIGVLDRKPGKNTSTQKFKGTSTLGTGVSYKVLSAGNDDGPYHPYYTVGGGLYHVYSDIAIYGLVQGCLKPSNLSVSDVTSSSAVLHWGGSSPQYQVDYGLDDLDPGSGTIVSTTLDSMEISSLTPNNTDYRFYVREICSAGDTSHWAGPITFRTLCGHNSVPTSIEPFNQVPPACWSEAQGLLSDSTSFISQTAYWSVSGYANDYYGNPSARLSIYSYWSYSIKEWLISPTYDLGTAPSTYQLNFDMIATSSYGTDPAILHGDDSVKVLISTDNGITWSNDNVLASWDSLATLPNPSERISIDLSAYTGLIKVAFYGKSSVSNAGYNLFIDNMEISNCSKNVVVNDTVCNSYTSPLGETYTASGTYYDTIVNATCDSLYTFNLNIQTTNTSSFQEIFECDSFVSVTGNVYTATGVYHDTIPNVLTCDSVIETDLLVVYLDPTVTQSQNVFLESNELDPAATYQWVNCSDLSSIAGATSIDYTATALGDYACQITVGNCTKLSECISVTSLDTTTISVAQYSKSDIKVYPNPNKGQFTLELSEKPQGDLHLSINNILSQEVYSQKLISATNNINLDNIDKGVYIINLRSPSQSLKTRVVID